MVWSHLLSHPPVFLSTIQHFYILWSPDLWGRVSNGAVFLLISGVDIYEYWFSISSEDVVGSTANLSLLSLLPPLRNFCYFLSIFPYAGGVTCSMVGLCCYWFRTSSRPSPVLLGFCMVLSLIIVPASGLTYPVWLIPVLELSDRVFLRFFPSLFCM